MREKREQAISLVFSKEKKVYIIPIIISKRKKGRKDRRGDSSPLRLTPPSVK